MVTVVRRHVIRGELGKNRRQVRRDVIGDVPAPGKTGGGRHPTLVHEHAELAGSLAGSAVHAGNALRQLQDVEARKDQNLLRAARRTGAAGLVPGFSRQGPANRVCAEVGKAPSLVVVVCRAHQDGGNAANIGHLHPLHVSRTPQCGSHRSVEREALKEGWELPAAVNPRHPQPSAAPRSVGHEQPMDSPRRVVPASRRSAPRPRNPSRTTGCRPRRSLSPGRECRDWTARTRRRPRGSRLRRDLR